MAFFLNACAAAVNWDYPRMPSKAFALPETTSVGALFGEAADKHPGLSGFSIIREGSTAFMARLAMADRCLDHPSASASARIFRHGR